MEEKGEEEGERGKEGEIGRDKGAGPGKDQMEERRGRNKDRDGEK